MIVRDWLVLRPSRRAMRFPEIVEILLCRCRLVSGDLFELGGRPFYAAIGVSLSASGTSWGSGPAPVAGVAKFWMAVLTDLKNCGAQVK